MYDEISPAELAARLGTEPGWQLVDVRESWELEIASLTQSIHIPMADIPARHEELDRSRPVAVLCHGGVRSARVAGFLCQAGFDRVANVTGGIDAWSDQVDGSLARY